MPPSLMLKIENESNLPDGGPMSVTVQGRRGIDIGRDQYLDWTLPDPSRFISGKHCEIRWRDGAYWLHDVSTNGTFMYGSDGRLKGPHKLRNGDRFMIGHYIIATAVEDEGSGAESGRVAQPAPSYDDLWNPVSEAAAPIDPRQLKAARDMRPVKPDFLDWATDVPDPEALRQSTPVAPRPAPATPPSAPPAAPFVSPPFASAPPATRGGLSPWDDSPAAAADDDMSWAPVAPKPPLPAPVQIPVPNPRRPVYVAGEPEGPWAGTPQPATTAPPANAAAKVLAAAQTLAATAAGAPAADRAAPDRGAAIGDLARGAGGSGAADPAGKAAAAFPIGPADATAATAAADFVRLVARGAGLPEDALASRNPTELADQLGKLLRLVAENTRQLLEGRQHARRLARSSNQTMIQALNNNPLKFAPTVDDALRIMFGPPTRSYLDAGRAFAQSFDDLKSHQVKTFVAMQQAMKLMLAEFDPQEIENAATGERGLAGLVGSRRAQLWDIFVARWQARSKSHEDGLLSAFMDYFAECYDRN
jgi:type VI secretion system protein ImpI